MAYLNHPALIGLRRARTSALEDEATTETTAGARPAKKHAGPLRPPASPWSEAAAAAAGPPGCQAARPPGLALLAATSVVPAQPSAAAHATSQDPAGMPRRAAGAGPGAAGAGVSASAHGRAGAGTGPPPGSSLVPAGTAAQPIVQRGEAVPPQPPPPMPLEQGLRDAAVVLASLDKLSDQVTLLASCLCYTAVAAGRFLAIQLAHTPVPLDSGDHSCWSCRGPCGAARGRLCRWGSSSRPFFCGEQSYGPLLPRKAA